MTVQKFTSDVMSAITTALKKMASLKGIGVFLLLFVISFIFISGKPFGLARMAEMTGGASIPDMEMLAASPQRIYAVLDAQGEAGRAFYLHTIIPQDFPFPLFYALFYATILTYLAGRLFPPDHPMQSIGVLGLLVGLVDWFENVCLLVLLLNYPDRLGALAVLASAMTIIKTVLILLTLGMIGAGFVWLLVRAVSRRERPA